MKGGIWFFHLLFLYSFDCLHRLYLGTNSAVNQAIISVTYVNTDLFMYAVGLGLNFVFISTVIPDKYVVLFMIKLEQN